MHDREDGARMYALIEELYPICRSITGDGVRDTLARIERQLPAPLVRSEVPSGTPVLDWTVPREWNIRDAWIADASGARVVDFHASNLHVVNYSVPVDERLPLSELRQHMQICGSAAIRFKITGAKRRRSTTKARRSMTNRIVTRTRITTMGRPEIRAGTRRPLRPRRRLR